MTETVTAELESLRRDVRSPGVVIEKFKVLVSEAMRAYAVRHMGAVGDPDIKLSENEIAWLIEQEHKLRETAKEAGEKLEFYHRYVEEDGRHFIREMGVPGNKLFTIEISLPKNQISCWGLMEKQEKKARKFDAAIEKQARILLHGKRILISLKSGGRDIEEIAHGERLSPGEVLSLIQEMQKGGWEIEVERAFRSRYANDWKEAARNAFKEIIAHAKAEKIVSEYSW